MQNIFSPFSMRIVRYATLRIEDNNNNKKPKRKRRMEYMKVWMWWCAFTAQPLFVHPISWCNIWCCISSAHRTCITNTWWIIIWQWVWYVFSLFLSVLLANTRCHRMVQKKSERQKKKTVDACKICIVKFAVCEWQPLIYCKITCEFAHIRVSKRRQTRCMMHA